MAEISAAHRAQSALDSCVAQLEAILDAFALFQTSLFMLKQAMNALQQERDEARTEGIEMSDRKEE